MKLLWLCNMTPGAVTEHLTGKPGSGLWVDHVLSDLRNQDCQLYILFPGGEFKGQADEKFSFAAFPAGAPHIYRPELSEAFQRELEKWQPDVIHIWGTEYAHTLAMVNAAEKAGVLSKVVISIQGLCSVYAGHYAEGVPEKVCRSYTIRDFLKQENIIRQQKLFALRGDLEVQALKKAKHVIGRTAWDKACSYAINPGASYHFCNETLRDPFYSDSWDYESCRKHRIFASSCVYPVKGFHYLLEAVGLLKKEYPDITIAVPGKSFLELSFIEKLRQDSYHRYLARLVKKYNLEDAIEFQGQLSPEGMKQQYLMANVFAMPSTIENSPNSLGEAMLLGTPCVSADVGGVTTMMRHNAEGYVYQSTAPYMLAHYIRSVFEAGQQAQEMGAAARLHARHTHDPEKNLRDLLEIYAAVAKNDQ